MCFGQKYPDERMLSERMFGSMMVSSASGLFRIRPETSQWGRKKSFKRLVFFRKKKTKTCVWSYYLITHRWQAPLLPSTQNHFLLHEQLWQWFSSGCPVKQRGEKSVFFSHLHTIGQIEGKQISSSFSSRWRKVHGLTWCKRNVPWQGIPPRWSTTAGM